MKPMILELREMVGAFLEKSPEARAHKKFRRKMPRKMGPPLTSIVHYHPGDWLRQQFYKRTGGTKMKPEELPGVKSRYRARSAEHQQVAAGYTWEPRTSDIWSHPGRIFKKRKRTPRRDPEESY